MHGSTPSQTGNRDQKQAQAAAAHAKARESYTAALESYHEALNKRLGELHTRLFALEGSEAASTLSRAALASEGELTMLLDVAAATGNAELAKAAFDVADRKGKGYLVARYFDEVDPDARDAYQEWHELPSEEVIARQLESVDRVIPPPRNLMPEPATAAYQ